jgi:hypothetical protein
VVGAPGPGIPRRRILVGLLLVPPAVSGCALGAASRPRAIDPLIALADAARADAALAAAAVTADAALTGRVQPLVEARTAHAAALDTEVRRLRPARAQTTPTPPPPVDGPVSLARVRAAARASADAAAAAALDLPVDRVGLVASIAACCAGYATVLT